MARTARGGWTLGLAAAIGLLALGCGGGSATAPSAEAQILGPIDPATAGTLSVHLVQDGLPGEVTQIQLVLASLELRIAGSDDLWRPVPLAATGSSATGAGLPLDLLASSSASPLVLASDTPWPPGSYDAMRFTLADGSFFATTAGGFAEDLETPAPFIRSMGLPGTVNVATGQATDLWITFSVADLIRPDPDNEGSYLFLPGPVRGYDRAQTGAIQGTLTAPDPANPVNPVPVAGATVTAQLLLPEGAPSGALPFRTAVTAADGSYTLDLLPRNYTWCAVSQAVVGASSYDAGVSPGLALGSPPFDQRVANFALTLAPEASTLSGQVGTPASPGQTQWVQVNQSVTLGGLPWVFAMRYLPVAVDGRFSVPLLPPGTYSAVLGTFSQDPVQGLVEQTTSTAWFDLEGSMAITFP